MYGKLKEGVLYYAPNEDDLTGYKFIIDKPPVYNSETQYLSVDNYTENKDSITIDYIINDITTTPTYEERLASVEEVILNLL